MRKQVQTFSFLSFFLKLFAKLWKENDIQKSNKCSIIKH